MRHDCLKDLVLLPLLSQSFNRFSWKEWSSRGTSYRTSSYSVGINLAKLVGLLEGFKSCLFESIVLLNN